MTLNRRDFIGGAAAAAAWFALAPWQRAMAFCLWEKNRFPTGVDPNPEFTGKLKSDDSRRRQNQFLPKTTPDANDFRFGSDGTFTFFHSSDFHRERPEMTAREKAVFAAACEKFRPQLAVLTGDNVNWRCKDLFESAAAPLVRMFTDAGLPLALTFGNHDTEAIGEGWYTAAEQWSLYSRMAGRRFVDRHDPSVIGGGVQAIDVRDAAGAAKFRLALVDSGDYCSDGYEAVRTPSVAWARQALKDGTPTLFFQHIVVPETCDPRGRGLFRPAKEGEPGVKTAYWTDSPYVANEERTVGKVQEPMYCVELKYRNDPAYLSEGDSIYDVWKKAPNFRGAYFGHDHKNSFDGITTDGVRLGLSKTLSESAYNDGDLALRVFRLHADGTYETDVVSEKNPSGTGFFGKLNPLKA